jgi:hypothetical protein
MNVVSLEEYRKKLKELRSNLKPANDNTSKCERNCAYAFTTAYEPIECQDGKIVAFAESRWLRGGNDM